VQYDQEQMIPQLKRFYEEFGIRVAESGGDVTRKNLSQVLKNPRRTENDVYREFTKHYLRMIK
jgi:hypothetical protein